MASADIRSKVSRPESQASPWLSGFRIYLVLILIGNLLWEIAHLPLYTIWRSGSRSDIAFAVFHCTLGDLLIALSSLVGALLIAGNDAWPRSRFRPVALLTIIAGIGYTVFSEWLNVVVRASWAYSEWMPVIALAGQKFGLSPLLQWIIVPAAAFAFTKRMAERASQGAYTLSSR